MLKHQLSPRKTLVFQNIFLCIVSQVNLRLRHERKSGFQERKKKVFVWIFMEKNKTNSGTVGREWLVLRSVIYVSKYTGIFEWDKILKT